MSRLIITEKPSVALEFARVLKADKFQGYYQNKSGDTITYCLGHLLRLFDPEEYDLALTEWSLDSLPIIPEQFLFAERHEASRQLSIIRLLLKRRPDQIVIATDAGREGELIARETLKWCGITDFSNVYRFWTSQALTSEVIEANLCDLKPAERYTPLYLSGYYRMLSDWLVGMNMTRLFSVKLRNVFSFGRVQIPLLSALVEVSESIKSFVSQPYFNLRISLSKDHHTFFAYYIKDRKTSFADRTELDQIHSDIEKLSPKAKTMRTEKEQKIVPSPQLYNLTSLQKDCNRFFGYRAAQTEQIAQSLYEQHKILSYPRSSSRVLSRADHELFCNIITRLSFHHPEIFRSCPLPTTDNTRIFDDSKLSDHHALIILDKLPATLSQIEINVATLILKSMASVLLNPHIHNMQSYEFDVCGKAFQARGIEVVNEGWKKLFSQEYANADSGGQGHNSDDDRFDALLPLLVEGDVLEVSLGDILNKKTKPPRPFNEASLLSFMEKYRLGTESTRASILEKIIKRRYAVRNKRLILATDKGAFLIRTIRSLPTEAVKDFASVKETATWEAMLESAPETFYRSIKMSLEGSIQSLKGVSLGDYQNKPVGNCPQCGKPVRDARYSYLCTSGNGCRFNIPKAIAGHTLTRNDITLLFSGSETRLSVFTRKSGQEFKARLRFDPEAKRIVFASSSRTAAGTKTGGSK